MSCHEKDHKCCMYCNKRHYGYEKCPSCEDCCITLKVKIDNPRCCHEEGTGINLYICGERVFASSLSREDVQWLIRMLKTKRENHD